LKIHLCVDAVGVAPEQYSLGDHVLDSSRFIERENTVTISAIMSIEQTVSPIQKKRQPINSSNIQRVRFIWSHGVVGL
jgi:hypothetical protein